MSSETLPNRTKLGLKDPRVFECVDRGNGYYSEDHSHEQLSSKYDVKQYPNCRGIVEHVRKSLNESCHLFPADSVNTFIPRDTLSKTMTFETIHATLKALECCSNISPSRREALAQLIYSGDTLTGTRPRRKLLAVLIYENLQEDLVKHITDGIDDSCLPLQLVPTENHALKCDNPRHIHNAINEYEKGQRIQLCKLTHAVMAPYFTKRPNRHIHYVLGNNDVLPILEQKDPEYSDAPDVSKSNSTRLSASTNESAYGGFSHVQRVRFHPSHVQFSPEDVGEPVLGNDVSMLIDPKRLNADMEFALKRLTSTNLDKFNQELASLLSFQDEDNVHLIKLLFTFEIKGARGTKASEFYLVFPWAQGNLWRFWRTNKDPNLRDSRCLWMAEQCHELGLALQKVHNDRQLHLSNLPDLDENDQDLYGRHGDIKAENILWVKSGDILVIADFGLGRLHSRISVSNDTKSVERTETYRAPEFDYKAGRISRACDIYSLGCMFLEFVTWQLEGWESVHDIFPKFRLERDYRYKFFSDIFFRITEDGGEPEIPIRKPKVTAWIKRLKENERCSEYHLQFLGLIEDRMLEPDAQKRIKIAHLTRELSLLARTCKDIPSFFAKPARSSMEIS